MKEEKNHNRYHRQGLFFGYGGTHQELPGFACVDTSLHMRLLDCNRVLEAVDRAEEW